MPAKEQGPGRGARVFFQPPWLRIPGRTSLRAQLRDQSPESSASLFGVAAIRFISHSMAELDGICCKPRRSV